jgi:hypothetical protein
LFLVDSESGKVDALLSLSPDFISTPSVSKDDQAIYFSRYTDEADIWMLTLNEEQK